MPQGCGGLILIGQAALNVLTGGGRRQGLIADGASVLAEAGDMNIPGYPEEPRIQVRVVRKPVCVLDGPQEGLLHDFLRL